MYDHRVGTQELAIDAPSDLVLLILRASRDQGQGPVSGTTRLQKLLFLLAQTPEYRRLAETGKAPALNFRPYRMGPFTPDVYDAVDLLAEFEPPLIEVAPGGRIDREADLELDLYVDEWDLDRAQPPVSSVPRPTTYQLTPDGKEVANALWDSAPDELRRQITAVVREFGHLDLRSLLRLVYANYPRYTTRSEIKSQIGMP